MKQIIRIPIRQPEIPENPYGYVYLTVDLLKNKKYIGKHKSIEFDTKYFGSNLRIERILKKRPETLYCMILEWAETEEQLNELEKHWIKCFDAVNSPDIYNIMPGGDGGALSGEALERMKQSRKGQNSGKDHWNYGKTVPIERKQHLSEINTGSGSPVAKSVYIFNLSGRLIKVCETRAKAAKEFQLTASKVSALCCKNDRDDNVTYHCNGYVFSGNSEYQIKSSVEESQIVRPGEKHHLSQIHKDRIAQKSKLFKHTKESKEKLRQAHLGTKLSEGTKAKISKSRKGKLTGAANPNYGGKAMTSEHYKRHSEFMKGKRMSPKTEFTSENSSGGNNSQAKAVVQLTENGEFVQEFGYLGGVKQQGYNSDIVSRCCKGKQNMYKGYCWMYKTDYESQ